jgi:hypothetical protein
MRDEPPPEARRRGEEKGAQLRRPVPGLGAAGQERK